MLKRKKYRLFSLSVLLFIIIAGMLIFLFFKTRKEDIISIDNEWFYVINSKIQRNFTGFKADENGLWRIVSGKVDFNANGLYESDSDLLYVIDGKVDTAANGLHKIDSDLWYLKEGKVDKTFSGIAILDHEQWRVESGIVELNYSGLYNNKGTSYNIVHGMVSILLDDIDFQKPDGSFLRGYVYKPSVFNGKTMIFCHGISDTSDRGKELARSLAEKGYTVFAFDFSGGGAYSKSDGDMTDMSVLTELSDIGYIYDFVSSEPYVDKDNIYLAGHSQGGIVSGLFAAENPSKVKALILYAPGFVVCENWAPASYYEIPDGEMYIDNDMFVGTRYYEDLWQMLEGDREKIYRMLAPYEGPVLMLHGTDDVVTPIDYTRKMCDYYINDTLIEYEGADHCFEGEEFQEALASDTLEFLENH